MTGALLRRIPSRRVAAEVQAQLRELVASGAFQPGERLPSERDLMEALGVSRTAIREGLRGLEALGLVTIRHGSGVYVQDGVGPGRARRLPRAARAREPRDLIEVRLIVEPEIAGLAALRRTADDVRRLKRDIEQFRAQIGVVRRPPTDLGFHVDLCRATHNPMLLAIVRWVIDFYARSGQIPVRRDTEDHAQIYEAVRTGDAQAARAAMRGHLEWVRDRL
jgi:GntR family transcriptional regulator, transcriptional repressor for pyruvate dehydrogenase complex